MSVKRPAPSMSSGSPDQMSASRAGVPDALATPVVITFQQVQNTRRASAGRLRATHQDRRASRAVRSFFTGKECEARSIETWIRLPLNC